MSHLTVLYSRTRTLGAALIRAGAWWGPWSHCCVVDGEHVIESLALHGGVVRTPLVEVIERSSHAEAVEIECPMPELGLEWARSTVGEPYDWTGVVGIPLRERDWQAPGRWYCSEHVEAALVRAGRTRWRAGMHGISPCQSYYVR